MKGDRWMGLRGDMDVKSSEWVERMYARKLSWGWVGIRGIGWVVYG